MTDLPDFKKIDAVLKNRQCLMNTIYYLFDSYQMVHTQNTHTNNYSFTP